jgi:hypothetical protein
MDLRELADAPRTDPPLQHQALHQQPTPSRVSWREAAPTRSGHDHRLTDGQLGGHLTDTLEPWPANGPSAAVVGHERPTVTMPTMTSKTRKTFTSQSDVA